MTSLPSASTPGAVAAEDHREPVRREADATQRPHVVVVERRGAQVDDGPARSGLRVGAVPDDETRERVGGGLTGGVGSEHSSTIVTGGRTAPR